MAHVASFALDDGQKIESYNLKLEYAIGGDTNTVFSHLDKQGGSKTLKCNAINAFEDLKAQFSLVDTYRIKNPFMKEYSWETLNPNTSLAAPGALAHHLQRRTACNAAEAN